MTTDNVIELAAYREERMPKDEARSERDADRGKNAEALLAKLRSSKRRIPREDRPTLVRNLGFLVERLDPANAKALAQKVLLRDQWQKRKRYIQLQGDATDKFPQYAASGGDFAGIIQRLVEEKVHKGFDRAQAMTETVYGALKKTSFVSPPRFLPVGDTDEADAAHFVRAMEKVFDKLAQEADLADHFQLVAKYPIYPNGPYWKWNTSLQLASALTPNRLDGWDRWEDDDEFQNCIPWWAPRCIVGHLYIPFECGCLILQEYDLPEIKSLCEGLITTEDWWGKHSSLIELFLPTGRTQRCKAYHRLPIWLLALPLPNKIVPCLYAAIDLPDGFYQRDFPSYDEPIKPIFTWTVGERIGDDVVFFPDICNDMYNTIYVCLSAKKLIVTGSRVDGDTDNFNSNLACLTVHDVPNWLDDHPVQRLLKLTMESEVAKRFVLLPRRFQKWEEYDEDDHNRMIFRPAFLDSLMQTPLRQNTIAAYLLRNFGSAESSSIFDALKEDALAKAAAARGVIERELSKFQEFFDTRYGK